MSWPGELRVIGTDIRKLHSFRAGESIHPHHRSLRSCVPPDSRSTRACTPRPRTNHAGVSLAFQGENRAQRRRGSHVVLRLRQQLLRRARTRVAAFGPLISARRSDTRSVDLQCTRSCRHFPQCHPCARFGPFGIRHLVQPAELRLAVCRLQMSPSPGAPRLAGAPIFRFEAPDMRRRFVAPEDFLWKATETPVGLVLGCGMPPAARGATRRSRGEK